MRKIRIYLDICCYNRPYDNQSQIRIEVETRAKLYIQSLVLLNRIDLVWSYMLDYENSKNPYSQKATAINEWKEKALVDVDESPPIIEIAKEIRSTGIKTADSLHIACAIYANCNYFVSTDKRVLKYKSTEIVVCDPIECLRVLEDAGYDE